MNTSVLERISDVCVPGVDPWATPVHRHRADTPRTYHVPSAEDRHALRLARPAPIGRFRVVPVAGGNPVSRGPRGLLAALAVAMTVVTFTLMVIGPALLGAGV